CTKYAAESEERVGLAIPHSRHLFPARNQCESKSTRCQLPRTEGTPLRSPHPEVSGGAGRTRRKRTAARHSQRRGLREGSPCLSRAVPVHAWAKSSAWTDSAACDSHR